MFRRKQRSDILDVATFVEDQLNESGQMLGYRTMHLKCVQSGLSVARHTVYSIMELLDPSGLHARLRRRLRRRRYFVSGPNHCWHLDGNDKLKPYGICIHGCIDGYSREIVWLRAYKTNNDPKVIAGYFLEAVCEKNGCPKVIRADRGTENVHVEIMQRLLRRNHTDQFSADRSFLYGRSTSNQRIEFFWGIARRHCLQFWMDAFASLSFEGFFCGDDIDKGLIQFCFTTLVQVRYDVARHRHHYRLMYLILCKRHSCRWHLQMCLSNCILLCQFHCTSSPAMWWTKIYHRDLVWLPERYWLRYVSHFHHVSAVYDAVMCLSVYRKLVLYQNDEPYDHTNNHAIAQGSLFLTPKVLA